jgi:hypothetical protein
MKRSFLKGVYGQSSFEFVMILGILFLIFVGAFSVVQGRMFTVTKERNAVVLEGLGNVIRSELDLAADVRGDYYREFVLPDVVEGVNYSIQVSGGKDVVLRIEDTEHVIFLNANMTGTLQKGVNVIRKVNNNITVNI